MSISDELMWRYLELLSFRPMSEIRVWKVEVEGGRNPRDIKVLLAQEIVERFHSRQAAIDALAAFEARSRGEIPDEMPEVVLQSVNGSLGIAHLLKQAGLVPSNSEANRLVEQGGVKLDGEKVSDKSLQITAGATVVVQAGKRKFARVTIQ
jgi:tyrosyl-tRNA synthetase